MVGAGVARCCLAAWLAGWLPRVNGSREWRLTTRQTERNRLLFEVGKGKPCPFVLLHEPMEMHRHTSTTLRPAGELQVSNSHSGLDIKDANGDYLYLHLNSQQRQAILAALQARA